MDVCRVGIKGWFLAFGPIVQRNRVVIARCVVLALLMVNCLGLTGSVSELPPPPSEVALYPAVSAKATEVVAIPQQAEPLEVAPPSDASPCEPLVIDSYGVLQSSPRIYEAARRYFLAHTGPGSSHALGPELAKERPTLRFSNANWRETGGIMQATVDEITMKYPDSVVVPAKQPLQTDACYDEVYLDLTEDGRYLVIVETASARPVFMYWTSYRP